MNENNKKNNIDKTYGLMEIVDGTSFLTEKEPEDTVFTFPNLLFLELICFIMLLTFLSVLSLLFNAPLEELANPIKTPNPAKAPWYFLGLQELVSYSAFVGGVLFPATMIFGLMSIPYLDKNPNREFKHRKKAIILFTLFILINLLLILIGTYFRGPNWSLVFPWNRGGITH